MEKDKEIGLDFITIIQGLVSLEVKSDHVYMHWLLKHKLPLYSLINIFKANKVKTQKIDLDVDHIGGQGSLTDAEEKALSEFFRQSKKTSSKAGNERTKPAKRPNVTAWNFDR